MKIVKKSQTKKIKNSDKCIVFDYSLNDQNINGVVIKLNGRYPETGTALNLKCKELAYIINGSGKIEINKKKFSFKTGDLIFIENGEKYFWEGKFSMFVPCAPAWYPEQHKFFK